jgi:hypothetical protein
VSVSLRPWFRDERNTVHGHFQRVAELLPGTDVDGTEDIESQRGREKMAFRIKDLLVAVSPVGVDGRLIDFPNAYDDCSRCTGLTKDCPGCTRIQCSDYPTRNFGKDMTIYEAVAEFQSAQLVLLKAELKLAQQRDLAAGKEAREAMEAPDSPELEALERRLEEALEELRRQRSERASA